MREHIEKIKSAIANKDERDRWIGIYIGAVAVILAICATGGANATKDAMRAHIEAANTWNFFQAKNLRRNEIRLAADKLELDLKTQPSLSPAARDAYVEKIKEYKDFAQQLTSDKANNEGLDELFEKARGYEKERDVAFRRDPYFDWAQALLQIAIVLATVCLVTGTFWLAAASVGLAAAGSLLLFNAYTLAFKLPWLG